LPQLQTLRQGIHGLAYVELQGERGLKLIAIGLAANVLKDAATDAVDAVLPLYRRWGLDGCLWCSSCSAYRNTCASMTAT
jgi:hypothetical protein